MKMLLKLAWRNLWRNKRRSVITILAVTFAVMLSIVMRGIQLGTYEANIRHMVKLFSGHIQLQAEGFHETPSLQKSFLPDEQMLGLLRQEPRIAAFTHRISGDGLVSYGETSVGAFILGINPSTAFSTQPYEKMDQTSSRKNSYKTTE